VSQELKRLKELEKLGFDEVWGNINTKEKTSLKINEVTDVKKLMKLIKS